MPGNTRDYLLYAFRRVLRPLVRLLIRSGVQFDQFTNLAKGVWPVTGSPLGIAVKQEGGESADVPRGKLAIRESLAK